LDARAGVRHSPPLIGDDFKACPWSTGICVPVECGRGGGWCFRRLCADAIHVECERGGITPLLKSMLMSLGLGRRA
jgi:hypothetical protein